jgi:hypothetical protein
LKNLSPKNDFLDCKSNFFTSSACVYLESFEGKVYQ